MNCKLKGGTFRGGEGPTKLVFFKVKVGEERKQ